MKVSGRSIAVVILVCLLQGWTCCGSSASTATTSRLPYQWKSIQRFNQKENTFLAKATSKLDVSREQQVTSDKANAVSRAKRTLLLCTLIYGSCYVSTKHLQSMIPGELINFIRFSIAALWFLPDIISFRGSSCVVLVGFELGMLCAVGFLAQAVALKISSASKTALFASLGVVVPPILNWLEAVFTKQQHVPQAVDNVVATGVFRRVVASPFFSPLLAMTGAAIVEWGGIESPKLSDLMLLVTPLCFATCFWRSEKHAARFPQDTQTITGLMLTTSAIFFCFWSLWTATFPFSKVEWQHTWQVLSKDWRNLAVLVFNGLVATAWTALSEQQSLKVLTAADTSVIYALDPVFASIFSYLLLKEPIGMNIVIGAVLIIVACISH